MTREKLYQILDVEHIIIKYLSEVNANGLCHSDWECGCGIDNLFPCENPSGDCVPAVQRICDDKESEWYGEMIYVPLDGEEGE